MKRSVTLIKYDNSCGIVVVTLIYNRVLLGLYNNLACLVGLIMVILMVVKGVMAFANVVVSGGHPPLTMASPLVRAPVRGLGGRKRGPGPGPVPVVFTVGVVVKIVVDSPGLSAAISCGRRRMLRRG